MHIVVCIKQILDPEIPPSHFEVDPIRKVAVDTNASLVVSTFDECAVEVALQTRDKASKAITGGGAGGKGTVTVLSVGPASVDDALRHALAMRCDKAVRIDVEDVNHLDATRVAQLLAGAIRRQAPANLVLFGRESGDWGCGQVGPMVAELLALPVLTNVAKVEAKESSFDVKRFGLQGWERFEVNAPAILTVTNSEENVPRFPAVRDKMQSRRKPIEVLDGATLGVGHDSPVTVEALTVSESSYACYIVPGESPIEKVDKLVQQLKEWKVI